MTWTTPAKIGLLLSCLLHVLVWGLSNFIDSPSTQTLSLEWTDRPPFKNAQAHQKRKRSLSKTETRETKPFYSEASSQNEEVKSIEFERLGIPIPYPRLSRILGEQGLVEIHVSRGLDGRIQVAVKPPGSGFHRLDEAAQSAISRSLANANIQGALARHEDLAIAILFRLKDVDRDPAGPTEWP